MLNGFVGSMAAFGTDHDLMQRLLTVETRRESQRTLAVTPLGTLLTLVIYLGLGAALFAFYAQHPHLPVSRPDDIVPHFVGQIMPPLLRGLMLSAIVVASIDSPLGSLAASFVTDIYRPLLVRGRSERHYLFVSRVSVAVFGIVLAVLAYAFSFFSQILWLAFKIAGVTFGSLLGVFLLGLLTTTPRGRPRQRRGDDRDGRGQSRAADVVRDQGAGLRLVVARDRRHRRHDGPRPRPLCAYSTHAAVARRGGAAAAGGPGGRSRPRQCLARSGADIFPSSSPARTNPARGTGDPDPRGPRRPPPRPRRATAA